MTGQSWLLANIIYPSLCFAVRPAVSSAKNIRSRILQVRESPRCLCFLLEASPKSGALSSLQGIWELSQVGGAPGWSLPCIPLRLVEVGKCVQNTSALTFSCSFYVSVLLHTPPGMTSPFSLPTFSQSGRLLLVSVTHFKDHFCELCTSFWQK